MLLHESRKLCKKEAMAVISRVQENAKRRGVGLCTLLDEDGQWCAVCSLSGQTDERLQQLPL